MLDSKPEFREHVKIGMEVLIAINPNDPEEYWIKSIVEHIETPSGIHYCENGVKVRISDGTIGYVKKISMFEEINSKNILDIIKKGETKEIEFKETFKVASQSLDELKCLRDASVKEVAAFMNTNGGYLFIGVNDKGLITGLDPDYKFVEPDRDTQTKQDKFKQEVRSYIKEKINDDALESEYDILIVPIENKEICLILINSSAKPVFVDQKITYQKCNDNKQTSSKQQLLYIRTDSGTQLLDPRKLIEYWAKRQTHQN